VDVSMLWNVFDGYLQLNTRSGMVLMPDSITRMNWKMNFKNRLYVFTIKYYAALGRLYFISVLYLYCLQTRIDIKL
jgi:hypothetical protein